MPATTRGTIAQDPGSPVTDSPVRVDPENAVRLVEVSDDSGFAAVVQGR